MSPQRGTIRPNAVTQRNHEKPLSEKDLKIIEYRKKKTKRDNELGGLEAQDQHLKQKQMNDALQKSKMSAKGANKVDKAKTIQQKDEK